MQNALHLFEKYMMAGKDFTIQEVLLEAGYSKSSAAQYTNTMKAIRPKLTTVIDRVEAHRTKVIELMVKKVGKAPYRDLVKGFDATTKAIQLLGGKPTEIIGLSSEDMKRLNSLVDEDDTGKT